MTDGLKDAHREAIIAVIAANDRVERAVLFGSRATGTNTVTSDVDIALFGDRLTLTHRARLTEALEEIPMAQTVDLILYDSVRDRTLRAHIRNDGVEWFEREHVAVMGGTGEADIRRAALADIIDLTLSSVDKKSKPRERPVRLCNYMDVYNNTFITDQLDFMAATATAREVARCSLARGDVIITKDSEKHDDIGVPALVRHDIADLVCGYHLAILRPRPAQVVGDYLVYALKAPPVQHQFHSYANGVTRFGLRKGDIGLVEVPLPPLSKQRAIARVLGTLDDKIELNRRMNETLEAMARALFKSWFVDFDPVRAKMEGRDPGLPPDIADLFPDRLVDSQMGEIPMGWEVKELGDLCHKPQYGYTASAQSEPVGPHFLRITDINKESWVSWSRVPYCKATDDEFSKYRLGKGDLLVARMADPGHGILVEEDVEAVFASYLIRFRPVESKTARLLQYWLKSDAYWHLVRGRATGTTRRSLNARVLNGFPLVFPPNGVAAAFAGVVGASRDQVVANVREMELLGTIRDTLLPKLISGQIRVGECTNAEAILNEVG